MELTDLVITADTFAGIKEKIEKGKPEVDIDTYLSQLDPNDHDVTKPDKRKDKTKNANGTPSTVPVNRLPVGYQKLIVGRAAAFLCGNPIQLDCNPTDDTQIGFLAVIQKVWDDNKLSFKSMELAKKMMSETECAELWYTVQAEEGYWDGTVAQGAGFKLRVKILANSLGDSLYPVYDQFGDMIAFGRGYEIINGDKKEEHFDVYMADSTYKGIKSDSGWDVLKEVNPSGKIPIIYYSQPQPEWTDVQRLIDRYETQLSNLGDTNDYFGSPIVMVEGEVSGFSDKGESGKVLQSKGGGKAYYLVWDQSPESTKLEMTTLRKEIYTQTDTPDISIEELKGLGTFSGIALKMLFLPAHLKAATKEGIFGESIQRRINFLKAAMAKIQIKFDKVKTLPIVPKFEYYLPKNDQETIDLLSVAVGGGKAIMSQETAIRNNPYVSDVDAEIEKMQEEGSIGADIETV